APAGVGRARALICDCQIQSGSAGERCILRNFHGRAGAGVKPASFDYRAPRTVDEAIAALQAGGGDAKLLAGGQSLIPLLNFRLARPTLLVDLNRIPELAYLRPLPRGVAIGAMTRQVSVERDAYITRAQPLLREAISWVGHRAIRSRGTIGGS